MGDEEENLVRPERVSALESSPKKIIFRRKNSNLGIAGISTYLEGEKTSIEKREKQTSKEEKAASRHFIISKNSSPSPPQPDFFKLNVSADILKADTQMVGPKNFINQNSNGFWYSDELEEESESSPPSRNFTCGPSPVFSSQPKLPASPKTKISSAMKAIPFHARNFSKHLKTYTKGRTSFRNIWMSLANSDLLEESCVKIQIPNSVGKRSVLPSSLSNKFSQSSSKLSGSFFNFVQDTSCLKKVENLEDEFMEVESVTSVSSAEFEPVEEEIIQSETEKQEDSDSLGPDFIKLFSSP